MLKNRRNGGSGEVLACGQPNIGVKLLKPFGGEEVVSGVAAEEGEFVADAKFMPRFENLLAVGTRRYNSLLASVNYTSKVKLWDVQRGQAIAKYKFNHLLQEVVTCPALPNNVWFKLGLKNVVEADVRTQSFTSLKLNDLKNRELTLKNCFDVCPAGGDTIAVGGSNKVRYYDRRMLTPTPYKVIDLRPLSDVDLVVTKLKYQPSGRRILMAVSIGFQHNFLM